MQPSLHSIHFHSGANKMNQISSASQSMKLRHHNPFGALQSQGLSKGCKAEQDRRGHYGDHLFAAMRTAYRPTGGVARGEDLAGWMAVRQRGDYACLARLIVSGEVFSFEWNDSFWVPMFQFDPVDLTIQPGPRQVVNEMHGDCDGWTLAVWFAEPNGWLNDRAPVDLVATDLPAVLNAARADRFVETG
jgi:hypothetical protein